MTLNYKFNNEDFEYDINIVNYMKLGMTVEEIGNLAYDIYEDYLTEDQQNDIKKDFKEYDIPKSFKSSDIWDSDILGLAYDIITETNDNTIKDLIGDDLLEYYREDAKDAWEDYGNYASDVYGSIGMKQRDFL